MAEAVRMAVEAAEKSGAARVLLIRLRVGALSGVVPEALEFAFEAMTKDTPAEGATLLVDHVPATFWCDGCQQSFCPGTLCPQCPQCQAVSTEIREGRKLELVSVEVE